MVAISASMTLPRTMFTISAWVSSNNTSEAKISVVDEELRKRLMDPNEHLTVLAFTDEAFNRLPNAVHQSIINQKKCYKGKL